MRNNALLQVYEEAHKSNIETVKHYIFTKAQCHEKIKNPTVYEFYKITGKNYHNAERQASTIY